jgi:hypothetical protein
MRTIVSPEQIIKKFNDYQQRYPQARLTILTNQPMYSPGDTIYFSTWFTKEDLSPISGQHVISFELRDESDVNRVAIRFKVADGKAYNQLVLPATLTPGIYVLVAYSDWMKNFGESWYFQKPIQIVRDRALAVQRKKYESISVSAEGGDWIDGVKSKLALTGPAGVTVTISDNQQAVASVQLDSTGFGTCEFTPRAGIRYQVKSGSSITSLNLPVNNDGISVVLRDANSGSFDLQLPINSAHVTQSLLALIVSQGKILHQKIFTVDDSRKTNLQFGEFTTSAFHVLYIFNEKSELLSERIFLPMPSGQPKLDVQLPQSVNHRQTNTVTIAMKDEQGNALHGNFTLSIIQSKLFPSNPVPNAFYLSDLPEVMYRLEAYGDPIKNSINDFLITQKWNRLNWKDILQSNYPTVNYPFRTTLNMKGEITARKEGAVLPDSVQLVMYLLSNTQGYETPVRKGKFEIPYLNDFWGNDRAFMGVGFGNQILDSEFSIKILNDSLAFQNPYRSNQLNAPSAYGLYASKKRIIDQSYSAYEQRNSGKRSEVLPNDLFEDEYDGADYSVNVADYVVFPNMKDLIHEIIPFVKFRAKGNEPTLRVMFRNSNGTRIYDINPVFIIDGVMTRSTPYFINLNPADILTIKIINNPNKLARMGVFGKNGVILVTSKKGNLGEPLLKENYIDLVGLSENVLPSTQKIRAANIPTTASTLYWNPEATIGESGKTEFTFNSTDDISKMKIIIQGITSSGKAIVVEKEFEVVYHP